MTRRIIRAALGAEHARLHAAMDRLADAVEGADRAALREDWVRFERALVAHLELEEEEVFPVLEATAPQAVTQARRDHARIRAALEELAVEVELHTLRKDAADRFIALLRTHAEREDAQLYRAADQAFSPEAARELAERAS